MSRPDPQLLTFPLHLDGRSSSSPSRPAVSGHRGSRSRAGGRSGAVAMDEEHRPACMPHCSFARMPVVPRHLVSEPWSEAMIAGMARPRRYCLGARPVPDMLRSCPRPARTAALTTCWSPKGTSSSSGAWTPSIARRISLRHDRIVVLLCRVCGEPTVWKVRLGSQHQRAVPASSGVYSRRPAREDSSLPSRVRKRLDEALRVS